MTVRMLAGFIAGIAVSLCVISNAQARATSKLSSLLSRACQPMSVAMGMVASANALGPAGPHTGVDAGIASDSVLCPGHDGWSVVFTERDGASWIDLLSLPSAAAISLYPQILAGSGGVYPNIIGKSVEWRYVNRKLVALIVHTNAQDSIDPAKAHHRYVVIRLNDADMTKSCWIGSADRKALGARRAMGAARKIADNLTLPCL